MFTGARKQREMDWQMVAGYFTVKSTDIFAVQWHKLAWSEINGVFDQAFANPTG